tara:strand:- start:151 stop:489 length:339 start_codon:yes stop_codon:yes gene_type:complete
MAEEHSISITFEKGNKAEAKTFSFKTQAEVEAFRDGVWEMFGNDDYRILLGRPPMTEAEKFIVKRLGDDDDYYPYGLYYDRNLVSGLKSNSEKEVGKAIKSVSKRLGIQEKS